MVIFFSSFLLLSLLAVSPALGAPAKRAAPTVTITHPQATIVGSTVLSVEHFNGVPFAQPPTGPLRLKPPQRLNSSLGTVEATGAAKACPQFFFSTDNSEFPGSIVGLLANVPLFQKVTNAGEDCLSVSIRRPAGTKADAKLPVLAWIYGGAFELGSSFLFDGAPLVLSSMDKGMPVIFVAINYRLGGFGFMPGKEILADGSANLGLLDQRIALEWVADNIGAFGGDPDKVTIWGESAGSISVFDQMLLYGGNIDYKDKALFHGAIMNSGSVVPADPVDGSKGQAVYDQVVNSAGCGGAADTLECLRQLDYTDFLNAANSVPGFLSYHSVALSYLPRPDGRVLTDSPDVLSKAGRYARVPFIIGDQEDEGTLFALFQSNITTTDELVDYFGEYFFHGASRAQLQELVDMYSDIQENGSPFRTSILNNWYPQFKRLAAVLGDLTFTLARRVLLQHAHEATPDVPSWSYLASYDYGLPIMGTFHASDILQVFYGILPNYASRSIHTYYLSFVYDQDPNSRRGEFMEWPQWKEGRELMNFHAHSAQLLKDDFRSNAFDLMMKNVDSLHI
ncbi:hypothetical protein EYZ11_010996 [Aspergillus tanneri]|uniref:Carboxylic ester hydrolase n=1 Tax=Aspergillus tanneri TaxID=1220188 RepID=A0A4S3J4I9_9EURO|nr:uncharacterized protein ATNIH1004_009113 [Aspergillus tanneri]KAA8644904.1 hypothetical protein ATNIH1004_009113 [Aspergillus tanneri]THC89552.1 hypothetical protein EYZ11_010996 [Aspergillus tanneri]